jgi:hypothetical protein
VIVLSGNPCRRNSIAYRPRLVGEKSQTVRVSSAIEAKKVDGDRSCTWQNKELLAASV